jgi:hypothetical protein
MSEYINNVSRRKEVIKNVLKQLHDGRSLEDVKAEFGALVREASSAEIAEVEQMLIEEGTSPEAIQLLCDVHVAVFQEALDRESAPDAQVGHPVFIFRQENQALLDLLARIRMTFEGLEADPQPQSVEGLREQLETLAIFERHYRRKENLLFPYLERYGFTGPSTVMWGIHDQIRAQIKALRAKAEELPASLGEAHPAFKQLAEEMESMVYKEEKILFPAAIERLKAVEWLAISEQESGIGHFMVDKPILSAQPATFSTAQSIPVQAAAPPIAEGELQLKVGVLTLEQVNLMLSSLPLDVTFVDEHDTVRFFSQSRERIFDREPAIIGRKVQNCHPPQSLDRVQRILDDFRAGRSDDADFWIQMGGRFIFIRYAALRDSSGAYRGTLEATQDLTELRKLEGERRLLQDAPA